MNVLVTENHDNFDVSRKQGSINAVDVKPVTITYKRKCSDAMSWGISSSPEGNLQRVEPDCTFRLRSAVGPVS